MKALSIKQPWAWAITERHKVVENRDWPTRFRGQFLIHAGLKDSGEQSREWVRGQLDWPRLPPQAKIYGGIVGIAEIYDCVEELDDPWFFGSHGFLIRNARPLPFYPFRGMLGFFEAHHPDIVDKFGVMK